MMRIGLLVDRFAVLFELRRITGISMLAVLAAGLQVHAQTGQSAADGSMQMTMPMAARHEEPEMLPPLSSPVELLSEARHRPPITLDAVLAQALAASPTLAQSRAQTMRLRGQARQASKYPNPTVGYQGDQIRGGSYGGGEQGAFVAQTIPLGGKLTLRRKAVEAAGQTSEAATETAESALRNEVIQAFYATLTAQQAVRERRKLLEVAEDAVATVHQLANVGQADVPDVLATEVEQETATLADAQAQHLYLARFHVLATLANNPDLSPALLSGDLAGLPGSPSLEDIVRTSPLLGEARAQIAAAEAHLAAARREIAPDLEVKGGEQYNFEQLGGAAANRPTGPQSFASAAITLPVWNRNQGNIAAAEAEVEAARQGLRARQLTLQQKAQPLLERYAVARQQAALYRTSILPRAARATQMNEEKYRQMAQAYPQVLVSRRTLLNLELEYNEALGSAWRAVTSLQNGALGQAGAFWAGEPETLSSPGGMLE